MRVIDSHTAGEPTRVVIEPGPDLGPGSLVQCAARLETEHRDFCASMLLEPRGYDALVGTLLLSPSREDCAASVIYFNKLKNLGMCGHATIGMAVTLAYLGKIQPGRHKLETMVGIVEVLLRDVNTVSVTNVESYRLHKGVVVEVGGHGRFIGDIAWGGNWFFIVRDNPIEVSASNIGTLTDIALKIKRALENAEIMGANGALIDHVELFGPSKDTKANSRNFVLCPDGAYDRSPCGTGCSAKLACLAEDGVLAPGVEWVQESIVGSTYRISYQPGQNGGVIPTITGKAFVTADAKLIFNPADPYRLGIRL